MKKDKPSPVRTTISLPQHLYDKAMEKALELHFSTFSDYMQHLLREEFILRDARSAAAAHDDSEPIKYPRPGSHPGKRGIAKHKEN